MKLKKKLFQNLQMLEDDQIQLDFSAIGKDNLIKELSEVDILSLNPMEAMNRLYALVKEAKNLI